MKYKFLLMISYIGLSLLGMAPVVIQMSPAVAGGQGFQRVVNALVAPTSSERFFQDGRRKFEQEIIRIRQRDDTGTADVLTLNASISQQRKELEEQEGILGEEFDEIK